MPAVIMTPDQFELCLTRHASAGRGVAAAWDVLCKGIAVIQAAKDHGITSGRVHNVCRAIKQRHMKLLAAYSQPNTREKP